jgi:hypothetical protein
MKKPRTVRSEGLTIWTLPYSTPQKTGVILFGLLVGALMVPITALGCALLGVIVVLFVGPGKDAWGGFFVAGCLLYGFYLGIPVGLVVCWKVCRSRLREPKAEN